MQKKKSNAVGSLYFNVPKTASADLQDKLRKCVAWMKQAEVYTSVSIKDGDGYTKYNGCVNQFKESKEQPDMVLFAKEAGATENKPGPKKATNSDDAPF